MSNNNDDYPPLHLITLVKSPSVQKPRIPKLPNDLHPLPPDISAYFVYPLSLEPYALNLLPNIRDNMNLEHNKHVNFLAERKALIENKKKEEMKKIAPGWNGGWDTLEPSRKNSIDGFNDNDTTKDLVDGLERLGK